MEWISVKDKMPELSEDVKYCLYLAIHKDWDNHCRMLMFDNEEGVFTRDGDDVQKVTHWMPIPLPPKD